MESIIPIKTDIKKFYKQYLNIIKPLLNPHLSNGEINVLGELMYLSYRYNSYEDSVKEKMIFDYDSKITIIDNLDTSLGTLNNTIMALRKKGYIKGNSLSNKVMIIPTETHSITFKFEISYETVDAK